MGANPHDEIKGSDPFPAFSRALENIVKFRENKNSSQTWT
jgi:hypothetical protein